MAQEKIRLGILGTSWIAPNAVILPAQKSEQAEVVAVASRSKERAQKYAQKHKIAKAYGSYEELLGDSEIDVIYNPLPNNLHHYWTIAALRKHKHVLCEKPIASNAQEAKEMAQEAKKQGCYLIEAFHYRFHPLALSLQRILQENLLGELRHIVIKNCFPAFLIFSSQNIRYKYDLAGGAMMDVGCYAVDLLRYVAGSEPTVESASAKLKAPEVDKEMEVFFRFSEQPALHAQMICSLASFKGSSLLIEGEKGKLLVKNPFLPHLLGNSLLLDTAVGRRKERYHKKFSTYDYQLDFVVKALQENGEIPTDAEEGVKNMQVIDAAYQKAGLKIRGKKEPAK